MLLEEGVDELEVPEDPSDLLSFDTSRLPLLVTLTKIGSNYVADVTESEEAAGVSSVVLAITPDGQVVHSRKVGSGTLFMQPLKTNWQVSQSTRTPLLTQFALQSAVSLASILQDDLMLMMHRQLQQP